jgi:PAS domain-containing protein
VKLPRKQFIVQRRKDLLLVVWLAVRFALDKDRAEGLARQNSLPQDNAPSWRTLIPAKQERAVGNVCQLAAINLHRPQRIRAGWIAHQLISLQQQREDGSRFTAEAGISKLNQHGRPSFTVIIRDVTAQQRAEAALFDNEARYRSIIGAMEEGVVFQDAAGQILI